MIEDGEMSGYVLPNLTVLTSHLSLGFGLLALAGKVEGVLHIGLPPHGSAQWNTNETLLESSASTKIFSNPLTSRHEIIIAVVHSETTRG